MGVARELDRLLLKGGVPKEPPSWLAMPFIWRDWSETVSMAKTRDPASLPNLTAIPAARSTAAVLKVRLYLVFGVLLFAAAAGVFSAAAWLTQKPAPVDLAPAIPRGQGIATLVAESFLAGKLINVPLAEGVEQATPSPGPLSHEPPRWAGFSSYRLPTGVPVENHRFLFYRLIPQPEDAPPVKQLNELSVLISFTSSGSSGMPVLGALPFFQPYYSGNADTSTFYGNGVDLPPEVQETVAKWSIAWAGGDQEQLRSLAGDGTPDVVYPALGGFTANKVVILNAAEMTTANSWLVRARVSLQGANGYATEMDMDLTVTGARPEPTYVVGWGPAGSGTRSIEDVRVPQNQVLESE